MAFFIPHAGCPHQCSFCDQKSITGESRRVEPGEVAAVLEDARQALRGKQKASEIAFFGGSFTAVPPAYQESLLKAAYPFVKRGDFSGIRISTRPYAIDPPVLERLKQYGTGRPEHGRQGAGSQSAGTYRPRRGQRLPDDSGIWIFVRASDDDGPLWQFSGIRLANRKKISLMQA